MPQSCTYNRSTLHNRHHCDTVSASQLQAHVQPQTVLVPEDEMMFVEELVDDELVMQEKCARHVQKSISNFSNLSQKSGRHGLHDERSIEQNGSEDDNYATPVGRRTPTTAST